LLALTTEQHGLIWTSYRFERVAGFLVMHVEHGTWFYIFGLYLYTSLLAGAGLIGYAYFGSHRIFRQQSLWTAIGALIPLLVNAIYVFSFFPGLHQDYSAIAFALAGLFFTVGIFRYRLLNLAPVARAALVETMPDGLLVLDPQMRVVDLNPAARNILGLGPAADVVGRPLHELWPDSARWDVDSGGWPDLLRVERLSFRRAYAMRASGLGIRATGQSGWLVVLSDVTQRVDAEDALVEANRSLAEANAALRVLNEDLEARIAARTAALTQRAQELEAVARVSSVLRKAAGLEELLDILVEETVAVLEASAGAVFLLEDEDLVLSAVQSLPALPGVRLGPCPDPLWRVVDSGIALHLSCAEAAQEPASDFFRCLIGRCSGLSIAPVHAANTAF
jgi:PAS domain S-box-containing protein